MMKKNTRRMRHNDFIPAGLEEEDLTSPYYQRRRHGQGHRVENGLMIPMPAACGLWIRFCRAKDGARPKGGVHKYGTGTKDRYFRNCCLLEMNCLVIEVEEVSMSFPMYCATLQFAYKYVFLRLIISRSIQKGCCVRTTEQPNRLSTWK